ncbi:hypothetical protein PG985_009463 [Apiospora marii]|uniref:uncharacterized protein n=1 Tax=Apiospora marii TaxID=335849 RepID=UPI00312D65F1
MVSEHDPDESGVEEFICGVTPKDAERVKVHSSWEGNSPALVPTVLGHLHLNTLPELIAIIGFEHVLTSHRLNLMTVFDDTLELIVEVIVHPAMLNFNGLGMDELGSTGLRSWARTGRCLCTTFRRHWDAPTGGTGWRSAGVTTPGPVRPGGRHDVWRYCVFTLAIGWRYVGVDSLGAEIPGGRGIGVRIQRSVREAGSIAPSIAVSTAIRETIGRTVDGVIDRDLRMALDRAIGLAVIAGGHSSAVGGVCARAGSRNATSVMDTLVQSSMSSLTIGHGELGVLGVHVALLLHLALQLAFKVVEKRHLVTLHKLGQPLVQLVPRVHQGRPELQVVQLNGRVAGREQEGVAHGFPVRVLVGTEEEADESVIEVSVGVVAATHRELREVEVGREWDGPAVVA